MKRIFYSVLLLALLIGLFQPAGVFAGSRSTSGAVPQLKPGPGWVANDVPASSEEAVYIAVLQDPALATYQDGIAGPAATNPEARGQSRLEADSSDSLAYLSYLHQQQTLVLSQIESAVGRPVQVFFRYNTALNQTYTVRVYDQDQQAMPNASVKLTREVASGAVETLTALTDLAGKAVFTRLNLTETAELVATFGSAESNAIELSPLLSGSPLP